MVEREGAPVALVGLMGAGKSAVARLLGARLGAAVAHLDARVEAAAGMPVAALFDRDGEAAFRARESEALADALAEGARVIDCGGGTVADEANRRLLRTRCRTVWLEVSPETAAARVAPEAGARPLLGGTDAPARLAELLRRRRAWYEEVAWRRVPTDGRTPAEVAEAVLRLLAER